MDAALTRLLLLLLFAAAASAATHPADLAVLLDIRKSLTNPDLLGWPDDGGGDACGNPAWPHVSCDQTGRVDNLDLKGLGLAGRLPASISTLAALKDLSLQDNRLSGPLPSFSGMISLERVFLNGNDFDSIPADFFLGLSGLLQISLTGNSRINASSGGWTLSDDIATSSPQLQVLELDNCGLTGAIPASLGKMTSLQNLTLTYNNLTGTIPASFNGSGIQTLELNNQKGETKLSGPLDVVATMTNLVQLWLHGNDFSGPVPDGISSCTALTSLKLNNNRLVGLVPPGLAAIPGLHEVTLDNNSLRGPVPALKTSNFTFSHNGFCSDKPGDACSPEVTALLQFLAQAEYPTAIVNSWSGGNPCSPNWLGVTCSQAGHVTGLNLQGQGLNGTIGQSLGNLTNLTSIKLGQNHLTGRVPESLTKLGSLQDLDLSMNDLSGPLPKFRTNVKVNVDGNLNFNNPAPDTSPSDAPPSTTPSTPASPGPNPVSSPPSPGSEDKKKKHSVVVLATTIPVALSVAAVISLGAVFLCRKRAPIPPQAASVVVHPRDNSDPDNLAKIVVVTNGSNSGTSQGNTHSGSNSSALGDVHIKDGNCSVETSVVFFLFNLTGKISTKSDVFSFGVVLMELITGLAAIDENRVEEETRYLASWFCLIGKDQDKLKAAIDPSLDLTDETFESICVIAELAGHCTAREPSQRPDMGHAVNLLVPMVEKWKPLSDDAEDYLGIDLHLPLLQMVKSWQDAEGSLADGSILSLEDSKGSIPARPAGFAESFTSADGR
ncbi:hypothetical protein EJB05_40260, partial [Eragrostis curvula]